MIEYLMCLRGNPSVIYLAWVVERVDWKRMTEGSTRRPGWWMTNAGKDLSFSEGEVEFHVGRGMDPPDRRDMSFASHHVYRITVDAAGRPCANQPLALVGQLVLERMHQRFLRILPTLASKSYGRLYERVVR